jgi:hypothetical protein
VKNNGAETQFFVDRNPHSGKIVLNFPGEKKYRAMIGHKSEGRNKSGKKPEFKKVGLPIAFGMP